MQRWIEGLPWPVKAAGQLLAAFMSTQLGSLSESLAPLGWLLAGALALWFVVGTIWHAANVWREGQGKPRLMLEPTYVIALGFVIVAAGFIWQAARPAGSAAQLQELTSKIDAIHASVNKYVKPRELTESQIAEIEKFLLPRPKHKFLVVFDKGNSESNKFAAQIYRALERVHWEPMSLSTSDETLTEGVSFNVRYPQNAGNDQNAADDLRRAFETAGVKFAGSGSSRNSDKGFIFVEIRVGHKPRQ